MINIHVTYWAPSLGASKRVQAMAVQNVTQHALVIPDFASVSNRRIGRVDDFSRLINSMVDRLVEVVWECETKWLNRLELDGSPLSYVNFARFNWIHLSRQVMQRVSKLVELTLPITKVRLLRPDDSFQVPWELRIIRPDEFWFYDAELYRTYCHFYGPQKIETHYVGSPNQ